MDLSNCGTEDECWGTLRSTSDSSVFRLDLEILKIGSSPESHIVLEHPSVSPDHCFLMLDPDGHSWLIDTSDNGTKVGTKLLQNEACELQHGQIFYLVHDADSSAQNLGFCFLREGATGKVMASDFHSGENVAVVTLGNECSNQSSVNAPSVAPPRLQRSHTGLSRRLEDCLMCTICCDLLYNPCSLQPCLHSFCTHCWLQCQPESSSCPICRTDVIEFNKNHQLSSLVDVYLVDHPDKVKPDEEKEAIKKLTDEMMALLPSRNVTHTINPLHTAVAPILRRGCVVCEWEFGMPLTSTHCPTHELCACCFRPIPDCRDQPGGTNRIECVTCRRCFCALVNPSHCSGCHSRCIVIFNELRQWTSLPHDIINGCVYETTILTNYLLSSSIPLNEFLDDCFNLLSPELFDGEDITGESTLCKRCATTCLSRLAYIFRASLPKDRFPSDVADRPDCYYGKHCRTQRNNPLHARRFNHICEQTRFN